MHIEINDVNVRYICDFVSPTMPTSLLVGAQWGLNEFDRFYSVF